MGASGWVYYVSYQEDIEQAFQALRQQVFESGRYLHWGDIMEYEEARETLCVERGVDYWDEEAAKKLLQEVGPIRTTKTQNIDELLQKPDDGQGTHSILDITQFSSQYERLPISANIFRRLFEDQRPTTEIVEAIVLHEVIWPRIQNWIEVNIYCLANPELGTIFVFSEEVIHFLTMERTPQQLIEAFIEHEEMWKAVYPCVCFEIDYLMDKLVYKTMLPFPLEKMMQFFGTQKPTKQVVEGALAQTEVWNIIRRWTGYYVVMYQNDLPSEIIFYGCSGD